jgi:hypothetical protein
MSTKVRKLTWQLTGPATVLYAAETVGTRQASHVLQYKDDIHLLYSSKGEMFYFRRGPVSEVEELLLHLVGARKAELELAGSWTLLAARLPKLR